MLEAAALTPADDAGSFWRLEMVDGGAVVIPVREVRDVQPIAAQEAPAAPADVEAPLDDGAEGAAACDPLADPSLRRWLPLALDGARRHGLDVELVQAVIAVESCGRSDAVSRKGAIGLMQLLPATARENGCLDPRDPGANIDAGCRHLARLVARMDGDLTLALAAYNAGEGAVARAAGVPDFAETKRYVRDVLRHRSRLMSAGAIGL
jgi:soluble lytic murein transglycosylase-like protein